MSKQALQKSIQKWQSIVDGVGTDKGSRNCALCQRYLAGNCRGCPVFQQTGEISCKGTPHEEWASHQFLAHFEKDDFGKIYCPECERLARVELEFLKGLVD